MLVDGGFVWNERETVMGYRRSPARTAARHAWLRFVDQNAAVIAAAGVPATVMATISDWDHFLIHGRVAGDPAGSAIDRMSEAQYSALVELAANYFAAGYEFYMPLALHSEDQAAVRNRFESAP